MSQDFRTMPPHVKANKLESFAWRKIYYHNQNFLIIFVGPPGVGKSLAAIRLAMDLDRGVDGKCRFNVDRVVFTGSDYLNLINSKLPKGSFIVFDECGVNFNSRDWFSRINKLISYTNQSFRYKNLGDCFTVPSLRFIDNQVRTMLHAVVIMRNVLPDKKRSSGVFEWLTYNAFSGKAYHPRPRIRKDDGLWYKVQKVYFKIPPKALAKDYETKKFETTDKNLIDYGSEMDLIEKISGNAKRKVLSAKEIFDQLKVNTALLKQARDNKSGKITAAMLRVLYVDEDKQPLLDRDTAYGVAGLLNKAIEEGVVVL